MLAWPSEYHAYNTIHPTLQRVFHTPEVFPALQRVFHTSVSDGKALRTISEGLFPPPGKYLILLQSRRF